MKKPKKIKDKSSVKPSTKSNVIKLTVLAAAVAASISVTFPSFAEGISLGGVDPSELSDISASGKASSASAVDIATQLQDTKAAAEDCADPTNINGLAHAQQKTLNDMKAMILTPINTDKMFSTASKGGCFNALKDFPNLSASIPSLSSIANSLKQTIISYATRKVCTAVNDALEEVIGPVNELMDEFTKNGQLDLTGQINKEMADQLYKIDPELGRVSSGVQDEYTWELGDAFEGVTGIVQGGTGVEYVDEPEPTPPKTSPSGSFMTSTGESEIQQQESKEDGSLTDSAKNFLKSIF